MCIRDSTKRSIDELLKRTNPGENLQSRGFSILCPSSEAVRHASERKSSEISSEFMAVLVVLLLPLEPKWHGLCLTLLLIMRRRDRGHTAVLRQPSNTMTAKGYNSSSLSLPGPRLLGDRDSFNCWVLLGPTGLVLSCTAQNPARLVYGSAVLVASLRGQQSHFATLPKKRNSGEIPSGASRRSPVVNDFL